MKHALTFIFALAATDAQAGTLLIDCQRYESKCNGDKCYALADGLKQDTKKEVLKLQKMELVHYTIDDTRATVSVDDEGSGIKYTPEFEFVTRDENTITLKNKTESGAAKERVVIDKVSGFYAKYLIHTDGSMKDVPIGEPYSAYFGWCEDKTPKKSDDTVPAATITPPAQPAASVAPQ
jgi:hypothetical protein